jgi:hypothetical protein
MARRRAHWSLASGRSGAQKLAGGGTKERGERGEPGGWLTEAQAVVWWSGDGGELAAGRRVGDRGARASGEGESELGRGGEVRGWFSPFYRGQGGGERGRAPGEEFRNDRQRGLKGGMNSGCKSRLRSGLRRGNGRP